MLTHQFLLIDVAFEIEPVLDIQCSIPGVIGGRGIYYPFVVDFANTRNSKVFVSIQAFLAVLGAGVAAQATTVLEICSSYLPHQWNGG